MQRQSRKKLRHILCFLFISVLVQWMPVLQANDQAIRPMLEGIHLDAQTGSQARLLLQMSLPVAPPSHFSMEKPSRIVLDFPGVGSHLARDKSRPEFNVGALRRASVLETEDRLRVVLDVKEGLPYDIEVDGNRVYVVFENSTALAMKSEQGPFQGQFSGESLAGQSIQSIDFRRGPNGEGRVLVDLSHPEIPIDFKEEGSKLIVRFLEVNLPERLARKLDVTDFGTPVLGVSTFSKGRHVEMHIDTHGLTDNIAYQADARFSVEVKPLAKTIGQFAAKEKEYTGEKLSLNFQDIEVRAVLQLIADFTGLNVVTSDAVKGNVTLRLQNVPWDQALDIILKTKGLDKRQVGNVMMIGPSEELIARENMELQASQQNEVLAPLHSEYMQLNYAKASDIAALLKEEGNSLLSERGAVSVDVRTNTLLVQDTEAKLNEVRDLVHRLDIPVRQVLIDSRIVFASDNFESVLGVSFGTGAKIGPQNDPFLGFSGQRASSDFIAKGNKPLSAALDERLHVALAPTSLGQTSTGHFGLTIAKLPGDTVLDLELAALESEGLGKIVGSPRLVTSNQQTAYIETGEEIPYRETTSSGAAAISFKKAVLRLEVTPLITPDDNIILTLLINHDTRGTDTVSGEQPAINKQEISTQVLVGNGRTLVLGGIYQQTKNNKVERVPFFGQLPYVGWMFRKKTNIDRRDELMIFVTPKIIQEGVVG